MLRIDRNARRRSVPSDFESHVYYGQLLNIYMLQLPPAAPFNGSVALLARVLPCKLEKTAKVRGFTAFSGMQSAPEVVDLQSLRAVVGRVVVPRKSYIADCSRLAIPTSLESDLVDE